MQKNAFAIDALEKKNEMRYSRTRNDIWVVIIKQF